MQYNDYQRNFEREVAKVKQFAYAQHSGRHDDPVISEFRVAVFKDLDTVYEPCVNQTCTLKATYPANWLEALKVTLPKLFRFKWVQRDLSFGWIRDMQFVQYAIVNETKEYTTQLTVKNFTVYVDNNLGAEVFREKFTPSEEHWYNVQPD
jgi:hypothetical protein